MTTKPWTARDWRDWSFTDLEPIPYRQGGVFRLANRENATVFYGGSHDLSAHLYSLLTRRDPLVQGARYFSYAMTEDYEARVKELLAEYQKDHGQLPERNK